MAQVIKLELLHTTGGQRPVLQPLFLSFCGQTPEQISFTTPGQNALGPARIRFKLFPQVMDVWLEDAVLARTTGSPHLNEDPLVGNHFTYLADEAGEDLKLCWCEPNRVIIDPDFPTR